MSFTHVLVYDPDGEFIGYAIKKPDVLKFNSSNIWNQDEVADLEAQLQRLNNDVSIREFWPDVRDPEVVALLDNPSFEPLKMSPMQVVDDDQSTFVWFEEPSDESPYGSMDEDASNIVYKWIDVPQGSDVAARVKKACEIVARGRANAYA